ncbi:Hypothetical predicted protein [Pelobates cultripes]|uniref:Uncharacterized protein n=1 Tax=Pelobates cultripes TaxID=61616 RepID=A0AAD1WT65_PELCU|nr:Hypothetical predicted protein [Pelobates cultripes]
MSDNISYSITNALRSTQLPPAPTTSPPESKPVVSSGRNAAKKSRYLDEDASKTLQTDRVRPITDHVVARHLRAPHRAKSVRNWKRAKALIESSESKQEEAQSESNDSSIYFLEHSSMTVAGADHKDGVHNSGRTAF